MQDHIIQAGRCPIKLPVPAPTHALHSAPAQYRPGGECQPASKPHWHTQTGYSRTKRGTNRAESTYPQPYTQHTRHLFAIDKEENNSADRQRNKSRILACGEHQLRRQTQTVRGHWNMGSINHSQTIDNVTAHMYDQVRGIVMVHKHNAGRKQMQKCWTDVYAVPINHGCLIANTSYRYLF